MTILGIFLCVISIFVIYKRLVYIFLGKRVKGIIIGYGNPIKGYKGIESYPYKVKYEYNNKEYIAYSIESVTTSCGSFPNKNLQREITIYFKKDKPEVVTIKEFNGTLIIGVIFLILGILSIIL
ncbi:MAG: hypothetical protein HFJ48_00525 [Clostridia bacterium]|nr:hypothetical protein [Clostridia bacterium]